MTAGRRHFPPPWDIEEHNQSCYIVRDGNRQALGLCLLRERARAKDRSRLANSGRGPPDRGEHCQATRADAQGLTAQGESVW